MVQKNIKSVLKSFSYNLTDYDLDFICSRLHHNYQDDLAHFLDFLAQLNGDTINPIKNILDTAKNSSEFYSIVDEITVSVVKEFERRGNSIHELV